MVDSRIDVRFAQRFVSERGPSLPDVDELLTVIRQTVAPAFQRRTLLSVGGAALSARP